MTAPLLAIEGLSIDYRRRDRSARSVRVIDDLDLTIAEGETLALVGESGSGKSTLAHAVTGLVPAAAGSIRFDDQELVGRSGRARRPIQRQLQLVFQNPLLSLSPRRRVGWQLHEPLRVHTDLDASGRQTRIDQVVHRLELSPTLLDRLPHELSGGQAQRVVLARALVLEPRMIVFDEPTSALDVSVQAGVLNLLRKLKRDHGLTYLFITHDLAVARHLADRIAVMRHGEIVELRAAADLFDDPWHSYTRTLLASSPALDHALGDPT